MNKLALETAKKIRSNVINNSFNPEEYNDFKNSFPKFYEMLQKKIWMKICLICYLNY